MVVNADLFSKCKIGGFGEIPYVIPIGLDWPILDEEQDLKSIGTANLIVSTRMLINHGACIRTH